MVIVNNGLVDLPYKEATNLSFLLSLNQIADEKYFLESGENINAYKVIYQHQPHWLVVKSDGFETLMDDDDYISFKIGNVAISFLDF